MQRSPWRTLALLVSLSISTAGCSGGAATAADGAGDGDSVFLFETSDEQSLDLRVQKFGAPVVGAIVQLMSGEGDLLFAGGTDLEGLCPIDVGLDDVTEDVTLIVDHEECVGEWSDLELRDELGDFAPSVRLELSVEGLSGLVVEMEDRP